jgi:type IV pilus assembly protein PilC
MATFSYKAMNAERQTQEGILVANSREDVASMLTKKGLIPLTVRQSVTKVQVSGKIPVIEKITFCRYMGIMLSTGLSLSEGIEVLGRETKNQLLKDILNDMQYGLEQGQQLSTIFERYPSVFESYFITLIRAGEVSGKLAEVFVHLETELRAEYSLTTKVKGALMYPIIIFVAMIGMGFLMFFFVLPQIAKVFLNMKLPLPAFTRVLFTVSLALSHQMIAILIGIIALGIGAFFAFKMQIVKDTIIRLFGMVPAVGNLIKKIDIARFCRIFSTLLRSAVPITEALEISLSLLTWKQFRTLKTTIPEEIRKGRPLAAVMRETNVFPSLLMQMVAAGEKTATLDSTMADLATFFEGEVEEEVKGLTQIIEPVMMLGVGIAVGVMILSIISPIYSVVGSMQQSAGGTGGM